MKGGWVENVWAVGWVGVGWQIMGGRWMVGLGRWLGAETVGRKGGTKVICCKNVRDSIVEDNLVQGAMKWTNSVPLITPNWTTKQHLY